MTDNFLRSFEPVPKFEGRNDIVFEFNNSGQKIDYLDNNY